MNKSFHAINWITLIFLAFVSGWNISCLDADLVELDDFSVSTSLLSVSGGGEEQESTENHGGPLAGISTRTLMVGSDFADASAQVIGGQVNFDASGTDFSGQVSYEFDVPLSILAFIRSRSVFSSSSRSRPAKTIFAPPAPMSGMPAAFTEPVVRFFNDPSASEPARFLPVFLHPRISSPKTPSCFRPATTMAP